MSSTVPTGEPRTSTSKSSIGASSVSNGNGLDPSHLQGEDEDEEVRNRRRKRRLQTYIRCASLTTVYYGCSMAYYTQRAYKPCAAPVDCARPPQWCHWDVADAIYFATVTMTTVGYGDLKPGPPNKLENQLVTVLLLIFGVIAVFTSIAQALAPAYNRLEFIFFRISESCVHFILPGNKHDSGLVDLDGDGLADYEEPPPALLYYSKGVSSWIFTWILSQLIFASIYMAMEPSWNFWDSLYLCLVTATTVGYGDVHVSDHAGVKLYASIHIIYSVSSLAALINTVQVLYSERMIQQRKSALLHRQLDMDLIESLDKDNNGLDKLEFVVGMLTKLEILHWDDVEPFLAQFDALDKDHSGRLDKQDLRQMVEERQRKVEEHRQAKLAARNVRSATIGVLPPVASAPAGAPASAPAGSPMGALARTLTGTIVGTPPMTRASDIEGGVLNPADAVRKFTDDDVDRVRVCRPVGLDGGASTPSSAAVMYGGIAQRNRELQCAGCETEQGAVVDAAGRLKPYRGFFRASIPAGLPTQLLSGRGRSRLRDHRRPRHLRGKVTPDS